MFLLGVDGVVVVWLFRLVYLSDRLGRIGLIAALYFFYLLLLSSRIAKYLGILSRGLPGDEMRRVVAVRTVCWTLRAFIAPLILALLTVLAWSVARHGLM